MYFSRDQNTKAPPPPPLPPPRPPPPPSPRWRGRKDGAVTVTQPRLDISYIFSVAKYLHRHMKFFTLVLRKLHCNLTPSPLQTFTPPHTHPHTSFTPPPHLLHTRVSQSTTSYYDHQMLLDLHTEINEKEVCEQEGRDIHTVCCVCFVLCLLRVLCFVLCTVYVLKLT